MHTPVIKLPKTGSRPNCTKAGIIEVVCVATRNRHKCTWARADVLPRQGHSQLLQKTWLRSVRFRWVS